MGAWSEKDLVEFGPCAGLMCGLTALTSMSAEGEARSGADGGSCGGGAGGGESIGEWRGGRGKKCKGVGGLGESEWELNGSGSGVECSVWMSMKR